jgi:hypothetical protein
MDGKKCEINSLKLLSYRKNQKVHKEKKKKETAKWIPQTKFTAQKQPKIPQNKPAKLMPRKFVTYKKSCPNVSQKRRPNSVGRKAKQELYTQVG